MEPLIGDTQQDAGKVWHGKVDSSGRILIPIELRHELNLEPGTPLVWSFKDSAASLMTYEETIRQIQSYFQSVSPSDDVWSETLIAERKREAAMENAKLERCTGEADSE